MEFGLGAWSLWFRAQDGCKALGLEFRSLVPGLCRYKQLEMKWD